MTEASAEEEFHFPSARTSPFEAPSAYGRARELRPRRSDDVQRLPDVVGHPVSW
jgi:hypothetical protein